MHSELLDLDMVPVPASDNPHQYPCPLCELTAKTEETLYTHLQMSHRKSRICSALLEQVSARPNVERGSVAQASVTPEQWRVD